MILVSLFVPKFFIIKCFLKTHHIDGRETHVKKTSTHLGNNHTENPAKRNTLGCPRGGSGCWAGGKGGACPSRRVDGVHSENCSRQPPETPERPKARSPLL